jgi:DNA-binding NarL/FixJ family response regulator
MVLADALPVVLLGLRKLLEVDSELKIVAETYDGLDAVQLAERYKPNILVIDQMISGLNGLDVARHLRSRTPRTGTIVLSLQKSETNLMEALTHGAKGVIAKNSCTFELPYAVRQVMMGRYYVSPSLLERPIETYLEMAKSNQKVAYDALTSREREVLQLAAEGSTSAEIANRLSISARTAETHRRNLTRKLGVHNHTELIRFAIGRGLVSAGA